MEVKRYTVNTTIIRITLGMMSAHYHFVAIIEQRYVSFGIRECQYVEIEQFLILTLYPTYSAQVCWVPSCILWSGPPSPA